MKNETKAIIIISALLLLSLITNGYFLGNNGNTDYSEQLRLYKELSRKSDITEGLLQGRITETEKEIDGLRGLSEELKSANWALKEANDRREQLDKIANDLSGRIRVEIVEGIQSIDSGASRLTDLERIEREERQALSGILGGE